MVADEAGVTQHQRGSPFRPPPPGVEEPSREVPAAVGVPTPSPSRGIPPKVCITVRPSAVEAYPAHQNSDNIVGGRLAQFWPVWQELGASPWIVAILRKGFLLKFETKPNLSYVPIPFSLPRDVDKLKALSLEVQQMLSKNAIELAPPNTPGFYSRLFLVPKNSGGWRPVIDLSALNKHVVKPEFVMETAESIRLALPLHAWVVSIDLQDAFFYVSIHPIARKYMMFVSLSVQSPAIRPQTSPLDIHNGSQGASDTSPQARYIPPPVSRRLGNPTRGPQGPFVSVEVGIAPVLSHGSTDQPEQVRAEAVQRLCVCGIPIPDHAGCSLTIGRTHFQNQEPPGIISERQPPAGCPLAINAGPSCFHGKASSFGQAPHSRTSVGPTIPMVSDE